MNGKNITRLLVGAWWGFLFAQVVNDIGEVSEPHVLTNGTAIGLIIAFIFVGIMGAITADLMKD